MVDTMEKYDGYLPCLPAKCGCQTEEKKEKVEWEICATASRELLTEVILVFEGGNDALHDRSSLDDREDLRRGRGKGLWQRSQDRCCSLLRWRYV